MGYARISYDMTCVSPLAQLAEHRTHSDEIPGPSYFGARYVTPDRNDLQLVGATVARWSVESDGTINVGPFKLSRLPGIVRSDGNRDNFGEA